MPEVETGFFSISISPKYISGQSAIDRLNEAVRKAAETGSWQDKLSGGPWTAEYLKQMPLTSELFEDAKAHIEQHGWCQGADINPAGQVCLRGAFGLAKRTAHAYHYAEGGRLHQIVARNREVLELMGIDPGEWGSIQKWNDHKDRTQEQVLDALTLAAKTLRDQGR